MATHAIGLLPIGAAYVHHALHDEERKMMEHRLVLTEVHQVLEEMVYDVETCEHECEVARLKHELHATKQALAESQEREKELVLERQAAFEFAREVEQEGHATMQRLNGHLRVVMNELAKKELLEAELAQTKEQLQFSAQMSKELAHAQREIRDLHRQNSIHKLLKTNGNGSVVPRGFKQPLDRKAMSMTSTTSSATSSPRLIPAPSLIDPSPRSNNQLLLDAIESDVFSQFSDKLVMNIFAYLDANSVLSISLVSCPLMSRVHTMFGMPPNAVMTNRLVTSEPQQPPLQKQQQPPPPVLKARSQSSSVVTTTTSSYNENKGRAQLAKAEQIVKSLKKDEIKLFHDMSTRVKTLESHLSHVQAEKEDITARLHSAESVRDFLMDKLKELEDRLSNMMDATAKKDDQNAMDREIIGFLDARIQEYELTVKRLAKQNEEYGAEVKRLREEHAAKVTIVQDMVHLLSDEKNDLDAQLKSQRKVLVREVKALRVQTQQLTHEKDRYFMQLKQLRHALQHLDDLG